MQRWMATKVGNRVAPKPLPALRDPAPRFTSRSRSRSSSSDSDASRELEFAFEFEFPPGNQTAHIQAPSLSPSLFRVDRGSGRHDDDDDDSDDLGEKDIESARS
jgi:hypothetical protein